MLLTCSFVLLLCTSLSSGQNAKSRMKLVRIGDGDVAIVPADTDDSIVRQQFVAESLQKTTIQEGSADVLRDNKDNRVLIDEGWLWPYGTVPYVYRGVTEGVKKVLEEKVFPEFHTKTCIRFVKRTNEVNYLEFINDSGCYSKLGMKGGAQPVSVMDKTKSGEKGCGHSVHSVMHELMHAIGFEHEHQRLDRDKFINVLRKNLQPDQDHNFWLEDGKTDMRDLTTVDDMPYCFGSIMHYKVTAFSQNPKEWNTMTLTKRGEEQLAKEGISTAQIGKGTKQLMRFDESCDIPRIKAAYKCKGEVSELKPSKLSCWVRNKKNRIIRIHQDHEHAVDNYYFQCVVNEKDRDWYTVPVGCTAVDGTKIDFGKTFKGRQKYVLKCVKPDGRLVLSGEAGEQKVEEGAKGGQQKGEQQPPKKEQQTPSKHKGHHKEQQQQQQKVVEQQQAKGEQQQQQFKGPPPTECVMADGDVHKIGATWIEGSLWYECLLLPDHAWGVYVIGCGGVRDNFVAIGKYWKERAREDSPNYYKVYQCQQDEVGVVRSVAVACAYKEVYVPAGCFKKVQKGSGEVKKTGWIGCKKDGDDGQVSDVLKLREEPHEKSLKEC